MQVRDLVYLLQKQNQDAELFFTCFINETEDGEPNIVHASADTSNFEFGDVYSETIIHECVKAPHEEHLVTIVVPEMMFSNWKRINKDEDHPHPSP